MSGPYQIVRLPAHNANPETIGFQAVKDVTPTPEEQAFSVEINRDVNKLRRLAASLFKNFASSQQFRNAYDQFFDAAQGGLQVGVGSLSVGRPALEDARQSAVLTLGRQARNRFLVRVLGFSLIVLIVSLFLLMYSMKFGSLVKINVPSFSDDSAHPEKYIAALGFAGIGIFLSINLTNAWYLTPLTWEKIDFLDRDGMPASLRMLGVFLVTAVLMVLLSARVLIIGVMSVELNDFANNILLSVLVGLLCGLGEVAVSAIIQRALSKPVEAPQHPGAN